MSSNASTLSRRRFLSHLATTSWATLAWPHAIAVAEAARPAFRERRCDVLVIGGSLGGVAAALAAARMGATVLLTEEADWIGGQATAQGVPLDEHPWIEQFGATRSYREFRSGVRDYYRRHFPLAPEARADPHLNPGG
jgi:NADPH-dependent 2,4-dienoyl-CoA reductase/sulfur reductase-like enzyme